MSCGCAAVKAHVLEGNNEVNNKNVRESQIPFCCDELILALKTSSCKSYHFGALGGAGATFAVELFFEVTAPKGATFLRRAPPHRYATPAANPQATMATHEYSAIVTSGVN